MGASSNCCSARELLTALASTNLALSVMRCHNITLLQPMPDAGREMLHSDQRTLANVPTPVVLARTGRARRDQKEVVRQEVQRRRLCVLLAAVHLDASAIVDVDVFLLRGREELLVVQDADVPRRLAHLHKTASCAMHANNVQSMQFCCAHGRKCMRC